MKTIEIDDDLYEFIASQTKHIGESASDILRRLLMPETPVTVTTKTNQSVNTPAVIAKVEQTPAMPSDTGLLPLIAETELARFTKRVEQFLFVLSQLFKVHGEDFAKVEQIRGKNRIYFAQSKEALLQNGSSTNPKAIPDSPFWVVTNNNTAKKVAMLKEVLEALGYDEQTVDTVIHRFAPETVDK